MKNEKQFGEILYELNDGLKIVIDEEYLQYLGDDVDGAYNIERKEIALSHNYERKILLHEAGHFLFNTQNQQFHNWISFNINNQYWDLDAWYEELVISGGYEFYDDTDFIEEIACYTIEFDYEDGIKSNIIKQIPLLSKIYDGKYGGIA